MDVGDNGIYGVAIGIDPADNNRIDIRVSNGAQKFRELKSMALTLENLAPLLNGVYQRELVAGNNITKTEQILVQTANEVGLYEDFVVQLISTHQ
ncbi:hypothetical protein NO2_0425 [Candidatus Termititenax persephonae]|uniref:Uncharacterized protein n=1 Tax=Candidatus Termititenax persephonae TaxID=2218525 RepID=A0A388TGA0_9BACT|nr:hypothetical protein NO2_0425 [Candidatus Termititenax persephonae]